MGYEVYHYTSMRNFQSILEGLDNEGYFTFWGSNIFYMNDPQEFYLGHNVLINTILPKLEEKLQIDSQLRISQIWNNDNMKDDEDKYNKALIHHLQDTNQVPFVISFSEESDNSIMWNKYGDKGKGVCLVLKEHDVRTELKDAPTDISVEFTNCITLYKTGYEILDENTSYLRTLTKFYNKYTSETKKCITDEDLFKLQLSYLSILSVVFSPLIKSKNFEFENEKRIIIQNSDINLIKYRCDNNGDLIPYIEHKIPAYNLQKVVIGPCCKTELTRKALVSQFKKYQSLANKNIEISRLSPEIFK